MPGELAQGSLSSTGIRALTLTRDFLALGAHACDNCQLLKQVDISEHNDRRNSGVYLCALH